MHETDLLIKLFLRHTKNNGQFVSKNIMHIQVYRSILSGLIVVIVFIWKYDLLILNLWCYMKFCTNKCFSNYMLKLQPFEYIYFLTKLYKQKKRLILK